MTTIEPRERGIPTEARYLSDGDRVLLFQDDELIVEGTASHTGGTVRVVEDDGSWTIIDRAAPGTRRHVRLLRSTAPIAEDAPVRLRRLDTLGNSEWLDGTIEGRGTVDGKPRYAVRYHAENGPTRLAGWYTAIGVHPDDLELREETAENVEQVAAAITPEMEMEAIRAALDGFGIPGPHQSNPSVPERIAHLIRLFVDQSDTVTKTRAALLPIVDDGSMTLDSIARIAARRYAEQRDANRQTSPHLARMQSTALGEVQQLAIARGGDSRLETIAMLRHAFEVTEERGANRVREEVNNLLGRYDMPRPRNIIPAEPMDWLDHALKRAQERDEEVTQLAGHLVTLGATPSDHIGAMVETALGQARVTARSTATAHAEQAAAAKITQLTTAFAEVERKTENAFRLLSQCQPHPSGKPLDERITEVIDAFQRRILTLEGDLHDARTDRNEFEKIIHDAFVLLERHIKGSGDVTLDQKLREVLANKDNQIAQFKIRTRRDGVTIVGVDRVRAVVDREVERGGLLRTGEGDDLGGWFLRTLSKANLAIIVHDWNGFDPVAEPVEGFKLGNDAPKPGPQFATVEKIFADVATALKPVLDDLRNLGGKP